jgi:hypothetical protein
MTAPYCSNWPDFEDWRKWDYNRCECEYMCDGGEINVEWDECGGIYEAYDQSYLCSHCRGRLRVRQTHVVTHTLNLHIAFLKSGAPSYEKFVSHMPKALCD